MSRSIPVSPLLGAAERGDFARCKELLEQGADVMARTAGGRTALHKVAWKGYLDIARLLVQHGARVDDTDDYRRKAIHIAVYNGNIPIVRYFLDECGEDIDQRDVRGKTLDQMDMDGQSEQEMKAFLVAYRDAITTERAIREQIPDESTDETPSRSRNFSPL